MSVILLAALRRGLALCSAVAVGELDLVEPSVDRRDDGPLGNLSTVLVGRA